MQNARDKPGHDAVFINRQMRRRTQAWLVTALPNAACAAASRAIGTR